MTKITFTHLLEKGGETLSIYHTWCHRKVYNGDAFGLYWILCHMWSIL